MNKNPKKIATKKAVQSSVDSRRLLWDAQKVASRIGVTRVRVCSCFPHQDKDIEVWRNKSNKSAYKNLIRCGSVWSCPVCSAKIRNFRKNEVLQIVKGWRNDGYKLAFVTLTKQHDISYSPAINTNRFKKVAEDYNKLTEQREFKRLSKMYGVEYIRGLETTLGFQNGFHPHLHIIYAFAPNGCTPEQEKKDMKAFTDYVVKFWLKNSKDATKSNQKVKFCDDISYQNDVANYISKLGLAYEMTNPILTKESKAKKGINPLSIPFILSDKTIELSDYEKNRYQLFFNLYELATKKRKFLTCSKGVKKRYCVEDLTDKEITESIKDLTDYEISITLPVWKIIIKNNDRAKLLELCEKVRASGGFYKDIGKEIDKRIEFDCLNRLILKYH